MVVVLNMLDMARAQGVDVDAKALSRKLGCPVVEMVAVRGRGLADLISAVRNLAADPHPPASYITYPLGVERLIEDISPKLIGVSEKAGVDNRWLAVRYIEGDDFARRLVNGDGNPELQSRILELEAEQGEDSDILIADGRFSFAHESAAAVTRIQGKATRQTSDMLDRVVLSAWGGPVIFLGLMYVMFMFTINLGGAFIDFFDIAAGAIFVDGVKALLTMAGAPQWLSVLLADGLGGGIQVVATFVPIIGFLYLFMSVLEDSGYMSRAAFLMDRLMRIVGLPGKAFVPLIVGFGCNVPSIMASRTLDKERDRLMTVMMSPFMSCGARLTVYALFAAAFFPSGGQNIVFLLYLIGIGAAIATGLLLKSTILKGETTPFVMELPPYHMPRFKDVVIHSWIRLKSFVFGAGKMIVMVIVVLNFLNSFGTNGSFGNEDSNTSVLSAIGRAIVPAFSPMGITRDNWPATVGLFTGVFAKEAVVGTLDSLYSSLDGTNGKVAGTASPKFDLLASLGAAVASVGTNLAALGDLFTDPLGIGAVQSDSQGAAAKAQAVSTSTFGAMVERFDGKIGAFAYLLFLLLYFPCVAAMGAVRNEAGPRWAAFTGLWTTGLAYTVAVIFYQMATFLRHPGTSVLWIAALTGLMITFVLYLRWVGSARGPASGAPAAE